ncbi:MAG: LysR family transcriptional regulator [Clostridia bacterium]|nr:LysR family transcriptional regulator [Clostridia bacterium]
MNTRQLQYAVLLAKARSFSHVAEDLGISQPALSKQIIALEDELGIRLFERTTPLTLTAAGEHFAAKAEKLLFEEEQLIRTMARYRTGESGKLVIGISPSRSIYLMPDFVRAMKAQFPHLQIILREGSTTLLHKGICDGLYDLAILNLPVDETLLDVHPMKPDPLVLVVPDTLLPLIPDVPSAPGDALDLAVCSRLPFVTLSPGQELRLQFDKLCAQAQFEPDIQLEAASVITTSAMVQAGFGAAVLPLHFMQGSKPANVRLFPLQQIASTRQPAVVLKRGQYISPYAEYAIKLLQST